MIRATRGRSMDGWSRPNHMPSRLDALRTMISVAFRRCVGSLHSVAKQASFDIASGSDLGGLRSDSMCCARTAALQGGDEMHM